MYVPYPHTIETLSDSLYDCVMEWDLDCRLSMLTVDNCSTSDKMIEFILEKLNTDDLWLNGKLFHIFYSAHIFTLIVKEDLSVIRYGIEKI